MSQSSGGFMKVRCPCGTKLKLPTSAAGRKAKCPKCEEVFRIPELPVADTTSTLAGDDDAGGSLLDDLAELQSSAPAPAAPASPPGETCPKCGAAMAEGTVLCVSCGFNRQSGRAVRQAKEKGAGLKVRLPGSGGRGSVLVGCVLSMAGALVGAVIWCVVALTTQYEIGWIAWALGLLAGGGMLLGCKTREPSFGVLAAAIALGGIVAAKVMMFTQVSHDELRVSSAAVASLYEEEVGDSEAVVASAERVGKAMRVAYHRADRKCREKGLWYGDPEWKELEWQEWRNALKLPPEELDQVVAEIDAWEAGAKWEDPSYVRTFLIYHQIEEALDERRAESGYLHEELVANIWKGLYDDAVGAIDTLSPEEQAARAKAIHAQSDRESIRFDLAWHHAELRAMNEGLPPGDDRRLAIEEDEEKKYEQMSDAELDKAKAALDGWEAGGKWDDPQYVRNYLVYTLTEEALADWQPRDPDAPFQESEWQAAWDKEYAANVYRVDSLSPDRQLARALKMSQPEGTGFEMGTDDVQSESAAEVGDDTLKLFIRHYFGVIDIIFAVLAVASAFGLAGQMSND
jgi:hypothetical protein